MIDYKYIEDECYVLGCSSCGCVAPLCQTKYQSIRRQNEDRFLCQICANSEVGNATDFYHEDVNLYRAMAQVGNTVVDMLTDRRNKLPRISRQEIES
jgi:hypothetical protein